MLGIQLPDVLHACTNARLAFVNPSLGTSVNWALPCGLQHVCLVTGVNSCVLCTCTAIAIQQSGYSKLLCVCGGVYVGVCPSWDVRLQGRTPFRDHVSVLFDWG